MSNTTDQTTLAPVMLRDDKADIVSLTLARLAQYSALSADLLTSWQTELDSREGIEAFTQERGPEWKVK